MNASPVPINQREDPKGQGIRILASGVHAAINQTDLQALEMSAHVDDPDLVPMDSFTVVQQADLYPAKSVPGMVIAANLVTVRFLLVVGPFGRANPFREIQAAYLEPTQSASKVGPAQLKAFGPAGCGVDAANLNPGEVGYQIKSSGLDAGVTILTRINPSELNPACLMGNVQTSHLQSGEKPRKISRPSLEQASFVSVRHQTELCSSQQTVRSALAKPRLAGKHTHLQTVEVSRPVQSPHLKTEVTGFTLVVESKLNTGQPLTSQVVQDRGLQAPPTPDIVAQTELNAAEAFTDRVERERSQVKPVYVAVASADQGQPKSVD